MNSNPMGGVCFSILLALSAFAVLGAQGREMEVPQFAHHYGVYAAGVGIGAALGAWGGSGEIGGHLAAALMIPLGAVGAFGCTRRNWRRDKQLLRVPTRTKILRRIACRLGA